jgi:hypothetical protein
MILSRENLKFKVPVVEGKSKKMKMTMGERKPGI